MKKNMDIISLPIISIKEGKEIGEVKDLVLNQQFNAVSYVVFDGKGESGIQEFAIPFSAVEGIGDYAMMISSDRLILDPMVEDEEEEEIISAKKVIRKGNILKVTSEFPLEPGVDNFSYDDIMKYGEKSVELVPREKRPSALQLELEGRVQVSLKKALTNKGRLVGTIESYYLDIEEGTVEEFICSKEGNKEFKFSPEDIINIGETVVILKDEVLEEMGIKGIIHMDSLTKKEPKVAEKMDHASGCLSSSMRENLLGKRITKDLKDEDGNIYLYQGTEINGELLDEIESLGKDSLMELFFVV